MIYWQLFIGFLQVGCFSFGGAYGAIPLIRDVVLANGWLTEEKLTYMIAVSESTPGPIMVNLATYVGSSRAGLLGAMISTLAVVLPSFFVILLIMVLLKNVLQQPWMQAVLRGVKPCMAGIILATGIYMVCSHCVSFGEHLELDMHSFLITLLLAFAMLSYSNVFCKCWNRYAKQSSMSVPTAFAQTVLQNTLSHSAAGSCRYNIYTMRLTWIFTASLTM